MARIDADNPTINAIVLRTDEVARAAPARRFPGLPLADVPMLKDRGAILAGVTLRNGSAFSADFVRVRDNTARWHSIGSTVWRESSPVPACGAAQGGHGSMNDRRWIMTYSQEIERDLPPTSSRRGRRDLLGDEQAHQGW